MCAAISRLSFALIIKKLAPDWVDLTQRFLDVAELEEKTIRLNTYPKSTQDGVSFERKFKIQRRFDFFQSHKRKTKF